MIDVAELARVMFTARHSHDEMSEEAFADESNHYCGLAEFIDEFIAEYEIEAYAAAKYILAHAEMPRDVSEDTVNVEYNTPSRVLP
jgi:hypothetical protein